MAETYIPFSLVTTLGTLNFNAVDGSSGYYLSDVAGLDGGSTRHTEFNLPQRDGAVVLDVLVGAAYITLTGEIRITGTDTLTTRKTLMDTLLAYCDSARKQDAILSFTPTGDSVARQMIVRLAEAVQIGNPGGVLKTFQIQLVAANPNALSSTLQSSNISGGALVGGALVFPMVQNAGGAFPMNFGDVLTAEASVTPGGTTLAWPVVEITGPVTSPIITNLTTGFQVSLPNLTLGSDTTLTIDMWNEAVYVGDPSNSYVGFVDFANSDFWALLPNTGNSVQVSGASSTDSPSATVQWRDTYVG